MMFSPYFSSVHEEPKTEEVTYRPPPRVHLARSSLRREIFENDAEPHRVSENALRLAADLERTQGKLKTARQLYGASQAHGGTCVLPSSATDLFPNICDYIGAEEQGQVQNLCVVPKAQAQEPLTGQFEGVIETDRSYIVPGTDEKTCRQMSGHHRASILCRGGLVNQESCLNYPRLTRVGDKEVVEGHGLEEYTIVDGSGRDTGVPCNPAEAGERCQLRCLKDLNRRKGKTWTPSSSEDNSLIFIRDALPRNRDDLSEEGIHSWAAEYEPCQKGKTHLKCIATGSECPSYVVPGVREKLRKARWAILGIILLVIVLIVVPLFMFGRSRPRGLSVDDDSSGSVTVVASEYSGPLDNLMAKIHRL